MEALSLVLLSLASFAIGLMLGAWLVYVAAWKRGHQAARDAQLLELEQWKSEALASRLRLASAQTMF